MGRNPYGQIPFFAPPWLSFVLSPLLLLPCPSAAVAWILTNIVLVVVSWSLLTILACIPRRYLLIAGILSALLPYAVFTYITGQLSVVALTSCTLSAWGLSKRRQGAVVIGLILSTLKPHVVALPTILIVLELVRQRRWSYLLTSFIVLLLLSATGAAFVPAWPRGLLSSWTSGRFYEPRENLLGLATFGVPSWLTYPFIGYALLLWWQRCLDLHTFALSVAVNLLAVPYSRSYDYVLLLIPVAATWHASSSRQGQVAFGLTLLAQLLPLVRVLVPHAGLLEALAPTLCTTGLMLVSRMRWNKLGLDLQLEQ